MIQKVRWQTGSEIVPDDIETSLTPSEKRFLGSYNESLRDLSSSLGIDLMFVCGFVVYLCTSNFLGYQYTAKGHVYRHAGFKRKQTNSH